MEKPLEMLIGQSNITLYQGDAKAIVPTLAPVNCIITDPPYGNTNLAFDKQDVHALFTDVFNGCKGLLPPAANIIVFGDYHFTTWLSRYFKRHFSTPFIWKKSRPFGFLNANRRPLRIHEYITPMYHKRKGVFNPQRRYDGIPRTIIRRRSATVAHYGKVQRLDSVSDNSRLLNDVYEFASEFARGMHPTTKPVALLERLVREFSNEGDTVLDPFCGGGSTLLACAKTGRNAIGIEVEPKYFELAVSKLQKLKGSGI